MGNVTSADNDKVNELLTRRAKKKNASSKPHRSPPSSQENSRAGSFFVHRQKSTASSSHTPTSAKSPRPLTDDFSKSSQADFYSRTGADYSPLTPTSPINMYSPPPTTTSTSNSILEPYPLAMQHLEAPPDFQSEPVIIPQQPGGQHPSANPSRASSPSALYLQQQQLSADLHPIGTSPEAKDWLKQKPTRSSGTHLIHQYNFHTHQYYQTPSSVKVVNNTSRNISGYSSVPLPRINTTTTSNNNNVSNLTTRFHSASISSPSPAEVPPKPRPRSITAAAALMSAQQTQGDHLSKIGLKDKDETISSVIPVVPVPVVPVVPVAPVSTEDTSKSPQPVSPRPVPDHFDGHFHGHGHGIELIHPHVASPVVSGLKKDRVGKLVMSLAKLKSPSATSLASLASTVSSSSSRPSSSGSTPGSPIAASDGADTFHLEFSEANRLRPSSTLSSLRSLLGNHPQGLSLIEALEDEDDEALESLSDTETGDSDADLRHQTELLDGSVQPKNARNPRRRPQPQFEWMDARKRFSASSLSTIGIDVKDSQKGQHALWKYIGGGNAHAPLRYDINRILDSGCGLGEWTMEMAKEYPNATVYGVDINPNLFPSAQTPVPSNCLFTQSNILTRMSFPESYFDFVYQRFLYLGLTVDDWPLALKELRRVMKPGGWIELFEPCMRVHRAGPRTRDVMQWISRLLQEERGLDFDFAGEKMQQLCESAEIGFENVKLERLSIPVGGWGGRVGEAMAENMVLMFQNLQSVLLENDGSRPRDVGAQRAFEGMVQSWIQECEQNKSYVDYYILVAQRPL
ncbi:hypothetical protein BGZ52_007382 [Haplosporangium bisporale]|nr:hypothetical protein BGZ52_007382 [Haplosporangium bisporale]